MNPLVHAAFLLPPLALTTSQIVIAALFVVGGLIKQFLDSKSASDAGRPAQRTPPLVPPRPDATPSPPRPLMTPAEERARRLMEALGLPGGTEAPPPPPVALPPRPTPPPLPPPRQAPPPPIFTAPPDRGPATLTKSRRVPGEFVPRAPNPVPPARLDAPVAPTSNLRGLLATSSREELRRAILLREVLGPPRALSEPGGTSM